MGFDLFFERRLFLGVGSSIKSKSINTKYVYYLNVWGLVYTEHIMDQAVFTIHKTEDLSIKLNNL